MALRHSHTVTHHVHTLLLLLSTITVLHTSITTSATLYSAKSGEIKHESDLLYLSIRRIDFNLSGVTINTSWLQSNYTDMTNDVVKIDNFTVNFTYSYSNDLDVEGDFFNISMLFWLNQTSSTWSMVLLQHQCHNMEDDEVNGTCAGFIYRYPVEISAPLKHGYLCNSIPEASNNSQSTLVITDILAQAFDVDMTNLPPNRFVNCVSPKKDKQDMTGLILGSVVAAAVVIAIVVVMATCLYRRRRRGKYNLLD